MKGKSPIVLDPVSEILKIFRIHGFFYTCTVINFILQIQHEIKEEEEHEDDGDAFVENVDEGDMEEEVVDDDDHTLEAEDFEEEEPAATSTPRRGHLPRPLVRFVFFIFFYEEKPY